LADDLVSLRDDFVGGLAELKEFGDALIGFAEDIVSGGEVCENFVAADRIGVSGGGRGLR